MLIESQWKSGHLYFYNNMSSHARMYIPTSIRVLTCDPGPPSPSNATREGKRCAMQPDMAGIHSVNLTSSRQRAPIAHNITFRLENEESVPGFTPTKQRNTNRHHLWTTCQNTFFIRADMIWQWKRTSLHLTSPDTSGLHWVQGHHMTKTAKGRGGTKRWLASLRPPWWRNALATWQAL